MVMDTVSTVSPYFFVDFFENAWLSDINISYLVPERKLSKVVI
jgi:hypothetical protein